MAVCVDFVVTETGQQLQATSQSLADCTAYVLVSAAEHEQLPTLVDIFTVPLADDLQDMFMAGFALPLILYLAALSFSSVVKFIPKG